MESALPRLGSALVGGVRSASRLAVHINSYQPLNRSTAQPRARA